MKYILLTIRDLLLEKVMAKQKKFQNLQKK